MCPRSLGWQEQRGGHCLDHSVGKGMPWGEFLQPGSLLPLVCFKFRDLFFFKHINIHLSSSMIPERSCVHTQGRS